MTKKRALLGLVAVIVVGGFVLALLNSGIGIFAAPTHSSFAPNDQGDFSEVLGNVSGGSYSTGVLPANNAGPTSSDTSYVVSQTETTATAESASSSPGNGSNATEGSPNGVIEFSTSVSISTPSPEQTASAISALAYSVGGYVAYQSTYTNSAYLVIRVPAGEYQRILLQVMGMGSFVSETSNSNDVSVQYTDLNATLVSLQTEQGALLKLLNQSSSINSTLAIETQLQQVNQQINEVESQILQTRTLVDFATINVTVSETPQPMPLSMTLSATPTNGTAPLSVTFNAIVKGGAQPYIFNYNFGDGQSSQGQIVIHTYYQPGDYKVVVSTTDQNGTVVQRITTVKVVAPATRTTLASFLSYVGGLFVGVVEDIVEVAVVVLPIAAVGAAIVIPIQRRGRSQKAVKQSP